MTAHAHATLHTEIDPTRTPRVSGIETARAFVRSAMAEMPREGVLAITVAAPAVAIEAPLRALRKGPTWVFAPSDGTISVAAIGRAMSVKLVGQDRLTQARDACVRLLGQVVHRAEDGALAPPLRAFVGLAFAPGSAATAPWDEFGDGLVALPRWTYASDGLRASVTLAIDCTLAIDERLAIAELEAMLGAIDAAREGAPIASPPRIVRTDHLDRERWARAIQGIRDVIASGDAHKIVASRRSAITSATDFEPLDVFARLEDGRAPTTRFLVRAGASSFVGATPEHLFTQRGSRITTEALAGSIATSADRAVEQLLHSEKDREEHAYVVRHLVDRLGPLCARVVHPDAPQVRRLPTVLHLRTPIDADLARPTHPIDVLAALHPTPAVGGTPPDRAMQWISKHEPAPRGWYGAPLGWVDARGDAELVVALRCGVIRGARAWLWAGGGIVAGSDADAEWDEAAVKMAPMLRALGAEP